MAESTRGGTQALSNADRSAQAALQGLDRWDALTDQFERHQASCQALEATLLQGDREMGLVFRSGEADVAAMSMLLAMEQNGYVLRTVEDDGGSVSYFEQAKTGHAIAVRLTPEARRAESEQAWSLLAETFGIQGPGCLSELDDFETAFEAQDLGRLEVVPNVRIYPKDDSGRQIKGPGRIKPPRRQTDREVQ